MNLKKRICSFALAALIPAMLLSGAALATEEKKEAEEKVECEHDRLERAANVEGICAVEGMKIMRCSDCEKIFYVSTSGVHMHEAADPVEENRIEATCLTDGSYDEVVYCADCKRELGSTHKTIPALGHSWDEGTVTKAATCTEDGVLTKICERGCEETEAIKATGHTPGEPVRENVVEATCESDGSYDSVVYCTECEAELSRETITEKAHGHEWDDGTVTREPTTESAGEKTYHCEHEDCTATRTEEIPALVPDNSNGTNGGIVNGGDTDNGDSTTGEKENGERSDDSKDTAGSKPDNSSAKKTPQIDTVSVPKTGDESHAVLWIALAMASGCTAAAVLRKKRYDC